MKNTYFLASSPTWTLSPAGGDTHRVVGHVSGRETNRRHFRCVAEVFSQFQQCDVVLRRKDRLVEFWMKNFANNWELLPLRVWFVVVVHAADYDHEGHAETACTETEGWRYWMSCWCWVFVVSVTGTTLM